MAPTLNPFFRGHQLGPAVLPPESRATGFLRLNAGGASRRELAPHFRNLLAYDKDEAPSDVEGHVFVPLSRLRPSLEATSTSALDLDMNSEGHDPTSSQSTSSGIDSLSRQPGSDANFHIYLPFIDRLCYLCLLSGTGNFMSLTLNNEIDHASKKHKK
jgi:hypothetical protein